MARLGCLLLLLVVDLHLVHHLLHLGHVHAVLALSLWSLLCVLLLFLLIELLSHCLEIVESFLRDLSLGVLLNLAHITHDLVDHPRYFLHLLRVLL